MIKTGEIKKYFTFALIKHMISARYKETNYFFITFRELSMKPTIQLISRYRPRRRPRDLEFQNDVFP